MLNWFYFFTISWGLPFTIYVILQIFVIIVPFKATRILLLIPAPIMLLIIIHAIYGYHQQWNLWPIYLILKTPLAIIYLVLVWSISAWKK